MLAGIFPVKSPPPARWLYWVPAGLVLTLALLGCAHRPLPAVHPALPRFQEFPVSAQTLAVAASQAVRRSSFGLELDQRDSSPTVMRTRSQMLTSKALKKLAWRGGSRLWGVVLGARLSVQLTIRPSYVVAGHSRITIQPDFRAYISRLGDQRQWIRWLSDGTLEGELFSSITTHLQPLIQGE